ncbi:MULTISPECIES: peptidase inhibitor family I36 protein [Streptomyces]|uniref:peptidase inhibitor family I36 protein n=1 Tax=Streptomyces TaxID=1883 RepID=UPI00163BDAD9|nr:MULTISPECIES: peptidase inhibitor family I36 protein [Streptomyces]MBC2874272.1 peptidase inhibitor family I36 protein [Streptomyces sp. TYQ1024]UBI40308.1 peptidase inhibitor family I36 protein [Streptomyces mobaraensis]UKW32888.1 peptidase inhibitor family I36 protein [Streptomyces sp. TYQ1024]
MFAKSKMTRFALGAAAAAGLLLATAPSASAATAFNIGHGAGSCPSGYVCLWSEGNFIQGGFVYDHKFGSFASNQNIGDMGKLARTESGDKGMQDVASSVVNNTGSSICFYEHNGYGGLQFKIGPHEQWPSVPSWINDKISSFKYC